MFDEHLDLGTTYLGIKNIARSDRMKADENFQYQKKVI